MATFAFASGDDITLIGDRIVEELMDSPVDDAEVENLLQTIQADGTWPAIRTYQERDSSTVITTQIW